MDKTRRTNRKHKAMTKQKQTIQTRPVLTSGLMTGQGFRFAQYGIRHSLHSY